MAESIHTARWISQLHEQGWDVHIFPSNDENNISSELKYVTLHHTVYTTTQDSHPSVKHAGFRIWTPVGQTVLGIGLRWLIRNKLPEYRVNALARLIKKLKPDVIHSLEFQHAGYMTLEAKKKLGTDYPFPPWIVSSWGNDIYLYRRIKAHQDKLRELLAQADYYISDCKRDIPLAQELGFKGEVLGAYLGGGGYRADQMPDVATLTKPSDRKVILLKGYQSFTGRAMFGLRAIALCKDLLQDYEIIIYFASSEDMRIATELTAEETGLNIRLFENATHAEWIDLLKRARINLGVSISDGTPLAMVESLLVGAFPIQTYTACADEWIVDGETGIIIPPEDIQAIADAIRRAVTDNDLVDNAAQRNYQTAITKLRYEQTRSEIVSHYEKAR